MAHNVSATNGRRCLRTGVASKPQSGLCASAVTFARNSPVVRATGEAPAGVSAAVRATAGTSSAAGETVGTFVGSFRAIDETVDAFAGETCLIFMLLRLTEVSWVSWLRQDDLTVVPPVTRSS